MAITFLLCNLLTTKSLQRSQLWDVTDDQTAVDLIRKVEDAQEASRVLLDYAITNYSTDNLSVMVIRFK